MAHSVSVATSGSVVDVFAGWILLGGGVAACGSLLRHLRRGFVARLRLVAAYVGIALFFYSLMPSVAANARAYRPQIIALAKQVQAGSAVPWPVRVGPFTFNAASVLEDGILLETRDRDDFSDGECGIEWSTRADSGLTYNWGASPVAEDLHVIFR